MDDSSSIGTHMEEKDSQKKEQAQQEEDQGEAEVTTNTKGARKLIFEAHSTKDVERGNLDLKGFEKEIQMESNGTVTNSSQSKDKVVNEENDQKQSAEPWVNMLKTNRVASNGIQLSYIVEYIPPQVVDGQAVVQLGEKEV